MKHLFFVLLLAVPLMVAAQHTKKDFKNAMGLFVAGYSSGDATSIFSNRSTDRGLYTSQKIAELKVKYGEIKSYSYTRAREDGMIIFIVKFVKPRYKDPYWIPNVWVGIKLDEEGKVLKLKFPTTAFLNGEDHYFGSKEY